MVSGGKGEIFDPQGGMLLWYPHIRFQRILAYKLVLKKTTEIRKRRDMGNPLQAVNSKYRTVDTAPAIMSQSKCKHFSAQWRSWVAFYKQNGKNACFRGVYKQECVENGCAGTRAAFRPGGRRFHPSPLRPLVSSEKFPDSELYKFIIFWQLFLG